LKKILIVIIIIFVAFIVIALASPSPAASTVARTKSATRRAPTTEMPTETTTAPTTESPPEPAVYDKTEFLKYVTDEFHKLVESGTLNLDSIRIDPITFEAPEFTPPRDIRLRAVTVDEYLAPQWEDITRAGTQIAINWLIEHGFDPKADGLMPWCSMIIPLPDKSPTGEPLIWVLGNSMYDPYKDKIFSKEWSQ